MNDHHKPFTILLADDDPEDRMLTRHSLVESRCANRLDTVEDGEELMDYLSRRGKFAHLADTPLPGLILLDLNMPKKDGREALKEIKGDPQLRRIPVVVLTSSKAEEDIYRTYDVGGNSFITKPVKFESLVAAMQTLSRYWVEFVEVPQEELI